MKEDLILVKDNIREALSILRKYDDELYEVRDLLYDAMNECEKYIEIF